MAKKTKATTTAECSECSGTGQEILLLDYTYRGTPPGYAFDATLGQCLSCGHLCTVNRGRADALIPVIREDVMRDLAYLYRKRALVAEAALDSLRRDIAKSSSACLKGFECEVDDDPDDEFWELLDRLSRKRRRRR